MSKPVNHTLVERLLEDETLTYREIARQAGCSDWSVRSIARDLTGDGRRMKWSADGPDDTVSVSGWLALAGFATVTIGVIWLAIRGGLPPPESGPMQ